MQPRYEIILKLEKIPKNNTENNTENNAKNNAENNAENDANNYIPEKISKLHLFMYSYSNYGIIYPDIIKNCNYENIWEYLIQEK